MTNTIVDRKSLLRKAADEVETPFYLIDLDRAAERFRRLRASLDGWAGFCFAIKSDPYIAKTALPHVDRLEICSFGEYRICREVGIPAEKMLISGVLKKPAELQEILDTCGSRAVYTAESPEQYRLLKKWADEHDTVLRVFPRLTSGNQFGMDEKTVRGIVRDAEKDEHLEIRGIHYFSGTQKRKPKQQIRELTKMDALLTRIAEEDGICLPELEYGPGLPASYFQDTDTVPEQEFLTAMKETIEAFRWKGRVTLETGRAAAWNCGWYLTKVDDIKNSDGTDYCIVDGGIHQLNYDGQFHGMHHPWIDVLHADGSWTDAAELEEKAGAAAEAGAAGAETDGTAAAALRRWTVCGSLCTVNDVLTAEQQLGDLACGDILVFERTGAYSMLEGMALFLSHEIPAVIGYSEEKGLQIMRTRRESWEINIR